MLSSFIKSNVMYLTGKAFCVRHVMITLTINVCCYAYVILLNKISTEEKQFVLGIVSWTGFMRTKRLQEIIAFFVSMRSLPHLMNQ